MGLLVGVVAAPCVGPVVLGLLAFVAATPGRRRSASCSSSSSRSGSACRSSSSRRSRAASRALPRAGAWMEGVKKVFGWILLAMAAYFLRTVAAGARSARGCCRRSSPSARWRCSSVHATLEARACARPSRSLFLAAAVFFAPRTRRGAGARLGRLRRRPSRRARAAGGRRLLRVLVPALHRARQEDLLGPAGPRGARAARASSRPT